MTCLLLRLVIFVKTSLTLTCGNLSQAQLRETVLQQGPSLLLLVVREPVQDEMLLFFFFFLMSLANMILCCFCLFGFVVVLVFSVTSGYWEPTMCKNKYNKILCLGCVEHLKYDRYFRTRGIRIISFNPSNNQMRWLLSLSAIYGEEMEALRS